MYVPRSVHGSVKKERYAGAESQSIFENLPRKLDFLPRLCGILIAKI